MSKKQQHAMGRTETLEQLQYLRGIAALAVVFYHIAETAYPEADAFGAIGVDIFFVISGFIMAKIVWETDPAPGRFLLRRLARVAPPYYLLTFAVFALTIVTPHLLRTGTDAAQLLHSLLFLPYWVDGMPRSPVLLVGWTLNYEIAFYLMVAASLRYIGDRSLLSVAGMLMLSGAYGHAIEPSHPLVRFYTDPIVMEFAFGIGAYHIVRLLASTDTVSGFGLVFACATVSMLLAPRTPAGMERVLDWGVPAALFVIAGLRTLQFKSPGLRTTGDWSYSIYLVHLFVVMLVFRIMLPDGSVEPVDITLVSLLVVSAVFAASWLFYTVVELPATRVLYRLVGDRSPASRKPAPEAGGAAVHLVLTKY